MNWFACHYLKVLEVIDPLNPARILAHRLPVIPYITVNQAVYQLQILPISILYVYKAHCKLSTESLNFLSTQQISFNLTSPPLWARPKSCQRISGTKLQTRTRLAWNTKPSARSLMRRWQLLVQLFGNGRNVKWPTSGACARSRLLGWR